MLIFLIPLVPISTFFFISARVQEIFGRAKHRAYQVEVFRSWLHQTTIDKQCHRMFGRTMIIKKLRQREDFTKKMKKKIYLPTGVRPEKVPLNHAPVQSCVFVGLHLRRVPQQHSLPKLTTFYSHAIFRLSS